MNLCAAFKFKLEKFIRLPNGKDVFRDDLSTEIQHLGNPGFEKDSALGNPFYAGIIFNMGTIEGAVFNSAENKYAGLFSGGMDCRLYTGGTGTDDNNVNNLSTLFSG